MATRQTTTPYNKTIKKGATRCHDEDAKKKKELPLLRQTRRALFYVIVNFFGVRVHWAPIL